MPRRSRLPIATLAAAIGLLTACSDAARSPVAPATGPDAAASSSREATAAGPTTSARWNLLTRTIIGRREPSSTGAARTFALVSVAQYDAVIAAERAEKHGVHPSESAAAGGASGAVLAGLYPVEQPFIDAALATDAAGTSTAGKGHAHDGDDAEDFAAGAAVGRTVAAAVLARAATDGSNAVWTGTIPVGPGFWRNAAPPAQPQGPLWGQVRPWLMRSGDQFRPPPPPAFGSAEFLASLAEVRQLSDTRTPEQLLIAQFWATGYGPGGPAGYFGTLAAGYAARDQLNERSAARAFAVLHMAIMDASIGCYEGKYAYWYIRPYQADAGITTPVGKPNFPSYPSAHSCLSSAAAGVLAALYPSETDALHAMVAEAGVSRMYAGLHYDFDVTAGQTLGYAVARLALRHAPRGHESILLECDGASSLGGRAGRHGDGRGCGMRGGGR